MKSVTYILCASLFCASLLFNPSTIMAKNTQSAAQNTTEKVFGAKEYSLDNGMKIIVVENDRVPVITHMVWYYAGAADEPRGKSGIAHFLEHLLFKGQEHEQLGTLEPGEFSRIVRSLGGNDNAFTSQDFTAYYQSISSDQLEKVMTMEAGRMRGINVPEEDFEAEKLVIQEERRQRTDNKPRARMAEQMREALFPNHPYSIPVIGWMHEVFDLKWQDAKNFYDKYYAPNNAVLIVSGDVKGEQVLEIAKRTYGLMKRADTPKRVRTTSPDFIAQSTVTLRHETIKEPQFKRTHRVPSYRQNKKHSLALQVMEDIMGGGSTSRIYKSLVIDQKIATSAGISYSGTAWDDGTTTIYATPSKPELLQAVQDALDDELRLLIKDGVSDEELSDSIKRMKAEAIFARDSISGPAMIIGYSIITGSTLNDIETWPAQIESVTKEDIQEAAALYLNPDAPYKNPPVIGILLPVAQTAAAKEDK